MASLSSWPKFVFKVMGQFYTLKDTIKSLRRIDLEFSPRDNTLYCTYRVLGAARKLMLRISVFFTRLRPDHCLALGVTPYCWDLTHVTLFVEDTNQVQIAKPLLMLIWII